MDPIISSATVVEWFNIAITAMISSTLGGVIGGLVAWGGIRIRLDHLEKKMTCLSQTVVYKDVCAQCRTAATSRENRIEKDITEIKTDIKSILNRSFRTREDNGK